MTRFFCTLFIAMLAATGSLPAQTDTVTILHLNDTHSQLAPLGPRDALLEGTVGGVARAATVIGMTRMETPGALVLHAGDVSIGDLLYTRYFAVAELQLLLALGVDAMTAGNHEFDLGPGYFEQMLDTAFAAGSFPVLSANAVLEDPAVAGLKRHIQPYTVKTVGSVKVGIFGLTTTSTNVLSQPAPAFFDTSIAQTAAAMVDTLTAQGCRLIICLSHLGSAEDVRLAGSVAGMHVIIGGHDHYAFTEPRTVTDPAGSVTRILQAESFYKAMGRIRFTVDGTAAQFLDYEYVPLDQNIPEEPATKAVVDELIAGIEALYGPMFTQQVGVVAADLEEVADSLMIPGPRDTPIGNLVTDAYRLAFQTDIAIQAGGSTAHPLYHGPITAADVFRVVGYGFNADNGLGYHMATFRMTGATLMAGLEYGLSGIELDDEFLLQVSGMSYIYDVDNPAFQRLIEVKVAGQPIDPSGTYTVAANEFVPMFLTAMGLPFSDLVIHGGDTTEFGILLQAIMAIDTVRPYVDGRVLAFKATGAVTPEHGDPHGYLLAQNYPNPFNPSTLIRFTLPVAATVRLTVYDVLGRQVATLLDGPCDAGEVQVAWHGTDQNGARAASGVYFYRMEAVPAHGGAPFVSMKKMALLK